MKKSLHLFEGFGIELEYMIVNDKTLSVLPVTDELIKTVIGKYVSDVDRGEIEWSNEIVLHVIELKTKEPATTLGKLPELFQENINYINTILNKMGGKLMPTGMHPWMEPENEMKLWPHGNSEIYNLYNKIFDCRGHGWSNLQSMHINLPFANDDEFGKLHAAIRLLLPIIPALTASSPLKELQATDFYDTRLEVYRKNQQKIPAIAGHVIPEAVFTKKDYSDIILKKIYSEIGPYDPDKILQYDWLNSRGAIARFDRNTIEIRIIDTQECVSVDIAIAAFIVELLKRLIQEKFNSFDRQASLNEIELEEIFLNVIKDGRNYVITNSNFLKCFNINKEQVKVDELWASLFETVKINTELKPHLEQIETLINEGCLSERILRKLKKDFSENNVKNVYNELCYCLAENKMFI